MNIIQTTKTTLYHEVEKIARNNIIKKLAKQGIDHHELRDSEFEELVADEIRILEHDSKKIIAATTFGLVTGILMGGI